MIHMSRIEYQYRDRRAFLYRSRIHMRNNSCDAHSRVRDDSNDTPRIWASRVMTHLSRLECGLRSRCCCNYCNAINYQWLRKSFSSSGIRVTPTERRSKARAMSEVLICVTWLVCTWDMTRSMRVTWLIYMCATPTERCRRVRAMGEVLIYVM